MGKSNVKKWSQIWTFLFENCLKSPRAKKGFFSLTFFTFEVPFNGIFSPTSRSRMSNIFRDSESLGKSIGKKWSQIWTFLFENCLKSPRKKKISLFFTFEVLFNGLFAPIFWSRMSNIFRDSESLEKSNGKKWSQIWTFLFQNCLKSSREKKFFSSLFSLLRYRLSVFLPPFPEVGCPIFWEIRNPWGKVIERSGLTFEHFLFGSGLKSPRKKKFFFADFALVHPPMASVLLSASVERCFVSRMRDIYGRMYIIWQNLLICPDEFDKNPYF